MKPRLLDLCCGAGGCAAGYARAGFDVIGVDHEPHPDFPFPMVVANALEVLLDREFLTQFDAIHTSPPCQGWTTMSNRWRSAGGKADSHDKLIAPIREGLRAWGGPYVLENVPGARRDLLAPVTLHGGMFGLTVYRPRLFETNWTLIATRAAKPGNPIGVYGKQHDGRRLFTRADGTIQRAASSLAEAQLAMGITWMGWEDLKEAVPPAYTEHIGTQLLAHLTSPGAPVAPAAVT